MRRISPALLLFAACSKAPTNDVPNPAAAAPNPTFEITLDFQDVAVGDLAPGFVIAATKPTPTLATWRVEDDTPPSGRVLKMVQPNHGESKSFNLCWNPSVRFANGSLEAKVRADEGEVDQGGGLIWRAQDPNNYYIARFNPLESNLRVYVVANSERKQLASADIAFAAGKWFTLRIEHEGDHIVVRQDGVAHLDVRDSTIAAPGGVGFWTKADAMTSFDDLVVRGSAP
jgi:hypothetical protein